MMLRIKILLIFLIPLFAFPQSPEEDQVKLQSALEWLDSKLNYIYYDNVSEQWWNNTFYVNDSNEATIKHIASNKPNTANIKNKTYTIRRFKIEDIDPRSLKIAEIKESRGRMVKGEMLELRTFSFAESIKKSINNRKASSTSFLFLSFPETLVDSLSNYAEIVKSKFLEAILASTQIYASGDDDTDIQTIINTLSGTFKSDNGDVWDTNLVQTNVLRLDRNNGDIEYFGYDTNDQQFYLVSISEKGTKRINYELADETRLILNGQDGQESLLIETPHSFKIGEMEFFRQ